MSIITLNARWFFLRVIAGKAKRTLLVAPEGLNTRPTADRAKEGLFNILAPRVRGARFLDMFCGSGAIGIEALSRGAAEAVFVENSPAAISALRKNLAKTRLSDAEIFELPVETAVSRFSTNGRKFDIIFLDPPYGFDFLPVSEARTLLAEGGIIIVETDSSFPAGDLTPHDVRLYGRTKFLFFCEDDT